MRRRYQHILVAVDGSKNSEKAFLEALYLARDYQSQLVIAFIDSDIVPYRQYLDEVTEARKMSVKPLARKREQAEAFGVEKVETIVESGNRKKYLAKILPKEHQIDLIVMGASQTNVLTSVLIGSTVTYVLAHAPCSVLVVK